MTPTGRWVYALRAGEELKLVEGAQEQEHFRFRVTDEHGNSTDSTFTIDITGENNAPDITANWEKGFVDKDVFLTTTDVKVTQASGVVIEDTYHAMQGHSSTKTTASSQEIHDGMQALGQASAAQWGSTSTNAQQRGGSLQNPNVADENPDHVTWSVEGSNQGTYGSLALDTNTGEWVYTIDNSRAATQALAAAQLQPGQVVPIDPPSVTSLPTPSPSR